MTHKTPVVFVSRRRVLGLGAGLGASLGALGGILPQPLIGVRKAMAEGTPETVVYVSNAGDPSVYVMAMNRANGDLEMIDQTTIPDVKPSPTSMPMAISPNHKFLEVALRSEPFTGVSFAIDPASGKLKHLGNAPLDASIAYTSIDHTGKWLLCASYPQGKLVINAIDADGRIKAPPNQIITDHPKAHCVILDALNKHAYCSVLAQDVILQFKFDAATGMVSPNTPAEVKTKQGAGPRHMAIHPNGKFLFLITETTATIGSYAIDPASGTLKEIAFVDMLAPGALKEAPAAADLHVSPDGHFLYGSERKTSSLVAFRIDQEKGTLSLIGRYPTETTPRGFAIEPRGKFLLAVGLDSNHMTVYAIRPGNGALDPIKQHAMGKMPNWIEIVDLKA
ncbi:MAG TPA: lactonase family protein [Stellaceae bacterium]|jgi:6-phosphogluconolactonase|nr:lactonase family protein [Stellaceae bacterium]